MIATHNQQAPKEGFSLNLTTEVVDVQPWQEQANTISKVQNFNVHAPLLLASRITTHNPKSGLNPLVDAASCLFSIIGKLKHLQSYRHLTKLQKELIQEVNTLQETCKNRGYNAESLIICRYVLCATIDDLISHTTWGGQGQWDSYSLLAAYNQNTQHQDKFFTIMERALKEPALYIDLMELMYICLSMGYKGQYRATEHSQYQLELITNNLYKHIRAYRGSFSKMLSPAPLKPIPSSIKSSTKNATSPWLVFFVTACIIMTLFVILGYLMDVISNETYDHVTQSQKPAAHKTSDT